MQHFEHQLHSLQPSQQWLGMGMLRSDSCEDYRSFEPKMLFVEAKPGI